MTLSIFVILPHFTISIRHKKLPEVVQNLREFLLLNIENYFILSLSITSYRIKISKTKTEAIQADTVQQILYGGVSV